MRWHWRRGLRPIRLLVVLVIRRWRRRWFAYWFLQVLALRFIYRLVVKARFGRKLGFLCPVLFDLRHPGRNGGHTVGGRLGRCRNGEVGQVQVGGNVFEGVEEFVCVSEAVAGVAGSGGGHELVEKHGHPRDA